MCIGPPGPVGPPGGSPSGGAIYTRWGANSCPQGEGTELLYSGIAGGSWFDHQGGAANYLCMPTDPEYNANFTYSAGVQGRSYVYGAEYQFPVQGIRDDNVPCAVCYVSTRSIVVMIPAKASCPPDWTREYYGYLMTAFINHHRTMYVCMDGAQESLPESGGNTDGALFYHVEANCDRGQLPCPPYTTDQELNCAVCTK